MRTPASRPDALPIRPGMDVYSVYQDQYIGSVVGVLGVERSDDGGTRVSSGGSSGSEAAPDSVGLVHEEGGQVGHTDNLGKRMLGEAMGPVPTESSGNSGPIRQSAQQAYGTDRRVGRADIRCLVVRPGRLNLGALTRPLYIPASAVRSISMERVVLDIQQEQLPAAWRHPPSVLS